ncbi:MAG: hypothetical protein MJZ55_00235 [Paludibacteraceae bacterium]|nr:hypothetical protein [Paludibacteraceae bacterium]
MYNEKIKTLDLSAFIEKTLEIIMVDGTVINLKRPTKAIVLMIQAAQESEATDYTQIVHAALNHNVEGVKIDIDTVKQMPDLMKAAIVREYFGFLRELIDNPNLQSRACPGKEKARKSPRK